eukprot:scaffold5905_cov137-Skeletonema_menzelii.AAC.3
MNPGSSIVVVFLLALCPSTNAFVSPSASTPCSLQPSSLRMPPTSTALFMAKSKTKKKKSAASSGGLKGFGGSSKSSTKVAAAEGTIDRSKAALSFYKYLESNGAEPNLKRVGLGFFPLQIGPSKNDVIQLRGVIALRDIPKGDPIIEIPYEMAIDLGRESSDPTLPATSLLQKYCVWKSGSDGPPADKERGDYFAMLPEYMSEDCLGSTDFFSDKALEMLQSPLIKEETLSRKELVHSRYERDVETMAQMSSNLYRWSEEEVATESHLQWASWIITSRVLTVQGPPESGTANRLLIPLIDMCNHDRDSPHILTGRAMAGATLKVVAGEDVKTGDAINISYGGSVEGNDRFIQDYGFLDGGGSKERGKSEVTEAYKIVAKKLTGRNRALTKLTVDDQERALDALRATTLEEDEEMLNNGEIKNIDERSALEFRIGMKKALTGVL